MGFLRRRAELSLFKAEKWVQIHAGKHPASFYPLYRLLRGKSTQTVTPRTEMVIEGYPRSANSFAVVAFNRSQNGRRRIANNLHVPAQIVRAAKWRIPALVLIRNPREAALSLAVRDPISISQALEYYVSFYETVEEYTDAFVLGSFEEVTSDYGAVIERVNKRFGTEFRPFRHTPENVSKVFERIDTVYERNFTGATPHEEAVSRPSAEREVKKSEVRREIESPKHESLLRRAGAVHERLTNRKA